VEAAPKGDTFYAWLTTHTSGDIVSIVKALGRENVWNLRKDIYEDYVALVLRRISKEWRKSLTRLSTEASL
jgi:hypothetical protein